jgi:glycyl-tRNA synthetase beta chain
MPELLVELFSEEIPARMQARAAEDLKRLVCEGLSAQGLDFDSAAAYATPRRLTLVIEGLPLRQPDVREEKKGPKEGAPDQAIQGFMKANGLADIGEAELRDTPKGRFYFVVRDIPGRESREVLAEALLDATGKLTWPKSMRWADGSFRWVRPLHSILAVFDGVALDGELKLGTDGGVPLGNETRGHRFLAPDAFIVSDFADYREKLHRAFVVLEAEVRKATILERARALVAKAGVTLKEDENLLDEVAGLVEWPVVHIGNIDPGFMDLPDEVLVSSLKAHQKYFSTLDAEGRIAPRFVFVANIEATDGGAAIVDGNERVLAARLADARFFWDQDRKESLEQRLGALNGIVFHAKLGTLADKVWRMEALASVLAPYIPDCDKDLAWRAARLAKADLVTDMVGEFPDLQGVMGAHYARHDGEDEAVAQAILEHYAPQGPADRCPSAPVSVAVALADKLDTLAGFWAIGETPTGSKDPFALRRAALGVIRLIVENKLRLPLADILEQALDAQAAAGAAPPSQEVVADLMTFFADRLKVALRDRGVRHDLVSAVFALGSEDDLVRLLGRVEALSDFLASEDGANLLVAHERATNIVRIEQKKDDRVYNGDVDRLLLKESEELALHDALQAARGKAETALKAEKFGDAMTAMAELRRRLLRQRHGQRGGGGVARQPAEVAFVHRRGSVTGRGFLADRAAMRGEEPRLDSARAGSVLDTKC